MTPMNPQDDEPRFAILTEEFINQVNQKQPGLAALRPDIKAELEETLREAFLTGLRVGAKWARYREQCEH